MIIDGKILGSILSPGQTVNLGLTLSAGVLSVCASDGSALSATNPGYVCMQTATAGSGGKRIVIAVTANVTINDASHASPQILGNLGTSASVAWGSSAPIFIGMINRDDTAANAKFCLSRCPLAGWQQTTTNQIGKSGTAPVTSDQKNIIIMDSGVTVGDYNGKPIVTLGSITAIKDASAGGSWTVDSLFRHKDGFGLFQEGEAFTYPVGQNGAGSASHIVKPTNAYPQFSTQGYLYSLNRQGQVEILINYSDDGGADGSDAVAVQMTSPLSFYQISITIGVAYVITPTRYSSAAGIYVTGANTYQFVHPTTGNFLYSEFTNGTRNILCGFRYKAF